MRLETEYLILLKKVPRSTCKVAYLTGTGAFSLRKVPPQEPWPTGKKYYMRELEAFLVETNEEKRIALMTSL